MNGPTGWTKGSMKFAAYTFLARDVKRWGKATSNAVKNVNGSLVDICKLPIYILIIGTIEKIRAKCMSAGTTKLV